MHIYASRNALLLKVILFLPIQCLTTRAVVRGTKLSQWKVSSHPNNSKQIKMVWDLHFHFLLLHILVETLEFGIYEHNRVGISRYKQEKICSKYLKQKRTISLSTYMWTLIFTGKQFDTVAQRQNNYR